MVINHVQPHLDANLVKGSDHLTKFADRIIDAVPMVRGEEIQRHVTPVIALLRIELLNREQFNNGDAQVLQVRNFLDQPQKGSALFGGYTRIGSGGKAFDVQLIHNHVVSVAWR